MSSVPQFIPSVSDADILRIVARDFAADQHPSILEMIRSVTVREKPRVVAACLKNAQGNLAKLNSELSNAVDYWREIISEAEYPNYIKKYGRLRTLSTDQVAEIIEKDKQQYLAWFNGMVSDGARIDA